MKKLTMVLTASLLGLMMIAGSGFGQSAEDIMKQSHLAYYYAGDDGVAEVTMRLVDKKGKERDREFVMLRLDVEEGGNQKYYTYFQKPTDVRRMTFMVHKTAEGNDKRWIYVPAVDLVRPISADDKNSSFVNSDFTYEDVSGRHWSEDNHTLKGDGEVNGTACYVVESVPKEPYDGFARKVTYIDKANMLPLKEEYFNDKDEQIREFTAEKVEEIEGNPTVTLRLMKDLKKNTHTYVEFSSIDYDTGLKEDIFTERYLKNPPRQYIK